MFAVVRNMAALDPAYRPTRRHTEVSACQRQAADQHYRPSS